MEIFIIKLVVLFVVSWLLYAAISRSNTKKQKITRRKTQRHETNVPKKKLVPQSEPVSIMDDSKYSEWPKSSNFAIEPDTDISLAAYAALFSKVGWESRDTNDGWEVECEWASLDIYGNEDIGGDWKIIAGIVVNVEDNWHKIAKVLKDRDISYHLEYTDSEGNDFIENYKC